MYIFMYIHMFNYINICMHIYICIPVCMHTCIRIYTHAYVYVRRCLLANLQQGRFFTASAVPPSRNKKVIGQGF